ncbi:succinylglutamate desuccinylase/aspartoacylase family protein [Achromobacter xylosoxidans]
MAARRRSPLDNGNLNRAFPGSPGGTPTERLAHFLEHELFPRHDVVFDIHSGGTSMAHLPTALIEKQADPARMDQALALLASLGMDHAFIATNGRDAPTSMALARAGAIGISGEFGGGGTLTPATLAATQRAIDQLLLALGVIDAPVLGPHAPGRRHAAAGPGQPRPGHLRHASRLVRARRGHRRPGQRGRSGGLLSRLESPGRARGSPAFRGIGYRHIPAAAHRQRSRRLPDPGGAPGRAS